MSSHLGTFGEGLLEGVGSREASVLQSVKTDQLILPFHGWWGGVLCTAASGPPFPSMGSS